MTRATVNTASDRSAEPICWDIQSIRRQGVRPCGLRCSDAIGIDANRHCGNALPNQHNCLRPGRAASPGGYADGEHHVGHDRHRRGARCLRIRLGKGHLRRQQWLLYIHSCGGLGIPSRYCWAKAPYRHERIRSWPAMQPVQRNEKEEFQIQVPRGSLSIRKRRPDASIWSGQHIPPLCLSYSSPVDFKSPAGTASAVCRHKTHLCLCPQ